MVLADRGLNLGLSEVCVKAKRSESPDSSGGLTQVVAAKAGPGPGYRAGVEGGITIASRTTMVRLGTRTADPSIGTPAEV